MMSSALPSSPNSSAPLRARQYCPDQQQELQRVGHGLRRSHHRRRHPRSPAAPLNHRQHPGRELAAQRPTQSWTTPSTPEGGRRPLTQGQEICSRRMGQTKPAVTTRPVGRASLERAVQAKSVSPVQMGNLETLLRLEPVCEVVPYGPPYGTDRPFCQPAEGFSVGGVEVFAIEGAV